MSVLVNGSPKKEFKVKRGLRQGDLISPFLFDIVAKGLKGLVNKAVKNGDFVGCHLKGNCFIDILRFAGDILFAGDGSWNHLWAIKSVLRGFELVSDLGINFHKRKLVDIKRIPTFMDVATTFLSCRREEKEFMFLGIPIRANPKRISLWSPLLLKHEKRLSS
ncbi:uncharacterized protein LOC131649521 [Vicia villosa]|uniref:uncharacterized protein LOC131649521 n=1 Tax=Vicia villosa TaxID=3911 RepID=UPI00273A760C|nr:uncharacterized protein LOC131649521 [Vicia villosa]